VPHAEQTTLSIRDRDERYETDVTLDQLTEDQLRAISDAGAEPTWLRDRRSAAFKRFADQAWPDSRTDEYWRSTPFDRRFDVERTIVAEAATDAAPPAAIVDGLEAATAVVRIVDGEVVDATVPAALADQGVVVTDLATAAVDHAELVERHLGTLTTGNAEGTGADEDRTVVLSDAAWTAGAFVHVPPEVELAAPIGVHVHVTKPGAHLPRVLAVVGRHAAVSLYLEHTSVPGVDALVDEVVEVVALDGSHVTIASLQGWADEVQHLSLQKTQAHRDTTVRHLAITTGGATVRLRPEFDIVGAGADVRPLGLYFADEGQWFDLQPYIRHFAPRSTSDVLYKGALQGRSRTVFRGNIFVHRDAVGTVTDENNRSLILTDGARADATPFLEIECADIVAGHGSATGQIDARHLFYLQSRGIRREEALRLIVVGFFREVLALMDLPGIGDRAVAELEAEIARADLERIAVSDAALRDHEED
jgi:Fe-S cluster assembly protein SufD